MTVSGNRCVRGEEYGKNEYLHPKRMLTTTVKLEGGKITALKDGTATFFYLCKTSCSGVVNYVASPLFTVTVGEQQNGAESVGATTPGSGLSTGTIILICAGTAVIVAAVIAAIVLRSKKNNA